jgi:hypothetical protein
MTYRVPVVSVVAGDPMGLGVRRLRLHHLTGSSSLAYESDVAIILNEKSLSVSKTHLAYDTVRARSFADWTVLSIEKNRSGPSPVDLEFRKDFEHFRFEPAGQVVSERLVDERIFTDQ